MSRNAAWQEFFDGHAPLYETNEFTKNTAAEVEFLLTEFKLPAGARLLDIGCGTGRHAVALARAGLRVTGVDWSSGMLAQARQAAAAAGVEVEWVHANAVAYTSPPVFDAAICLCEGGFTLFALDEDPRTHDLAILRNVFGALKPGGRFVLNALNAFRMIRAAQPDSVAAGTFDPLAIAETSTMEWDTPAGKRRITAKERGWFPADLRRTLEEVGFRVDYLGGGTAGRWGRRPLELDEYEIMAIVTRP